MKAIELTPFDYVLESEREKDEKTTFKLRPLSGMERLEMGTAQTRSGTAGGIRVALTHALLGWENLKDKNGKEIEFNGSMSNNLARLAQFDLVELFNEVANQSEVSEEQAKN